MGCDGGFAYGATDYTYSGLEADVNDPPDQPVDSGTTFPVYYQNGAWNWADTLLGLTTPGINWCYEWPVEGYPEALDFGTGGPPCASGQSTNGEDEALDASLTTQTVADTTFGGPPAVDSEPPAANYTQPAGPVLTEAQLLDGSLASSTQMASDSSPTSVVTTRGTFRQVAAAIDPTLQEPSAPTGGFANWMNSDVDLIVMHGQFTLQSAPVPMGHAKPQGTVLDIVVDAHTGAVDGIRLDDSSPAGLSALPAAMVLK